MSKKDKNYPAHNVIEIDNVIFSSNFDNGNLLTVEKKKHMEYMIWSACDNEGTTHETKHCTWFYFTVRGLPQGSIVKFHVMNQQRNGSLYKFDHRPVFRCESTGMKWGRIRTPCKFNKNDDCPLTFEHQVADNGTIHFAFTYPYTYTMVQDDLDALSSHVNVMEKPDSMFYQRELLTCSPDGLRIDLITISSVDGAAEECEVNLPGLFPDNLGPEAVARPPIFPNKEIIFISSRVHSGEVPAQHAFKGILDFLMDAKDLRAKELRRRYVFKMIPILNPDGVFRGHFRCDQFGNNLNRHYINPDSIQHPSIYAVKHLQEYYARNKNIAMYLDLHAHASKRGCFIYGNVMDSFDHQVQNQLFCKLIAYNTAHFDYDGCLFSRDHMQRVDPGDRSSGLTAEGSGRVSTFLSHKIIHSYTLECNYNCSKFQNEVVTLESNCLGAHVTKPSAYATTSERYTPSIWEGVGRACMVSMLDLRGHNPCSRIPMTKVKTLERIRLAVMGEVRQKSDYKSKNIPPRRRGSVSAGENLEIPWVSRTDEVFVPQPKPEVKNVSLPKVQKDQTKAKCLEKEKIVTKSELLRMKQTSISLPSQIDNSRSNAASAVQYPTQQPQSQHHSQVQLQAQPKAPDFNKAKSTYPEKLKYKRYFNCKENNTEESNEDSCDQKSGNTALRVTSPSPSSDDISNPPTKQHIHEKKGDSISSLPLTPNSSPPKETEITQCSSQQSIIRAPQIVFQAPSPPKKFEVEQEKSTTCPPDGINLVPVPMSQAAKETSAAEMMSLRTDSKEYLPNDILKMHKVAKGRSSRIPRSSRGKSAAIFASNE